MIVHRPENGTKFQWRDYWRRIEVASDEDLRDTAECNLEARLTDDQWRQTLGAIRLLGRDEVVHILATQANRDAHGCICSRDPAPDEIVAQFFHLIQLHIDDEPDPEFERFLSRRLTDEQITKLTADDYCRLWDIFLKRYRGSQHPDSGVAESV